MLGTFVQAGSLAANKKEVAQLLVAQYDALLSFLKSHGALLNAVKPELLLDIEEFRSGLAAGSGHHLLIKEVGKRTNLLSGVSRCAVTQPQPASARGSSQLAAAPASSGMNPCSWQFAVQPRFGPAETCL